MVEKDNKNDLREKILAEACRTYRIKKSEIESSNFYPGKMMVMIFTKDGRRVRYRKKQTAEDNRRTDKSKPRGSSKKSMSEKIVNFPAAEKPAPGKKE